MLPLLIVQGGWDEAWELAEISREDGSPLERQMAVMILGNLARLTGDRGLAWRMVSELLPRGPASEPDDGLFPYTIEMLRLAARLALDEANYASARDWIATHDRWLDWSGAVRGRSESALLKAWLALVEGDLDSARECGNDALRQASDPRQPMVLLDCHETIGLIEHRSGDTAAARAHLERALEMANTCEMPYQRARVLLALSDVLYQHAHASEAAALREESKKIALTLKASPLITELAQRETAPVSSGTLGDLTARETEVLQLVAQGYTDAAVADALSISPRTVGQHLRSIYNKLDVSSRAAATRRAVEAEIL